MVRLLRFFVARLAAIHAWRKHARPGSTLLLLVSVVSVAGPAGAAETNPLRATLECPPEPARGRVSCRATVQSGLRLAWVDALVVRAPSFAPPLRARVTLERGAAEPEPHRATLALPLLAHSAGEGELLVRVRAVLCPEQKRQSCRTRVAEVRANVSVRD